MTQKQGTVEPQQSAKSQDSAQGENQSEDDLFDFDDIKKSKQKILQKLDQVGQSGGQ